MALGFWRIAPLEPVFPRILFLYSLLAGAIFILNQITDYETDRLRPDIWLIASDKFPRKTAAAEMVVITAAALIGSCFFFPAVFIFLFTLLLGIVYCLPPIRFSGKPIYDFITNGLGHGVAPFALGWTAAGGNLDWDMVRAASPYLFLMMAGAVNSTIPDIDDDRKTGKITTAVRFGRRKAILLSTMMLLASINLAIIFSDPICLLMGLFSLIFFIKAVVSDKRVDYLKTLHVAGPLVMFIAAAEYPPILIPMILVYLLSKWYYPWRFGVDYPRVGK